MEVRRRRGKKIPSYKVAYCYNCGFAIKSTDKLYAIGDKAYHIECLERLTAKALMEDFGVSECRGQDLLLDKIKALKKPC